MSSRIKISSSENAHDDWAFSKNIPIFQVPLDFFFEKYLFRQIRLLSVNVGKIFPVQGFSINQTS